MGTSFFGASQCETESCDREKLFLQVKALVPETLVVNFCGEPSKKAAVSCKAGLLWLDSEVVMASLKVSSKSMPHRGLLLCHQNPLDFHSVYISMLNISCEL